MLQYGDLSLGDVNYYWGGSILLLEKEGRKIPCKLYNVDTNANYPIVLRDLRTGERLVSLRLPAFIKRVLIHYPALGYGDYKGVPLYLSPRAGRERRKGVDDNNLSVLCPVNWAEAIIQRLKVLHKQGAELIDSGKTTVPQSITVEYIKLMRAHEGFGKRGLSSRRARSPLQYFAGNEAATPINLSPKALASVLYQCTNSIYPSLVKACRELQVDKDLVGMSVSKEFALIHDKGAPPNSVALYHKMAMVGHLHFTTKEITFNAKLNNATRRAIDLAFNRVRR